MQRVHPTFSYFTSDNITSSHGGINIPLLGKETVKTTM